MKKIYMTPTTDSVEVKTENLLVQYSNSEAAKGAASLSRESSSWDDED